jgi:hypothetical protein
MLSSLAIYFVLTEYSFGQMDHAPCVFYWKQRKLGFCFSLIVLLLHLYNTPHFSNSDK